MPGSVSTSGQGKPILLFSVSCWKPTFQLQTNPWSICSQWFKTRPALSTELQFQVGWKKGGIWGLERDTKPHSLKVTIKNITYGWHMGVCNLFLYTHHHPPYVLQASSEADTHTHTHTHTHTLTQHTGLSVVGRCWGCVSDRERRPN